MEPTPYDNAHHAEMATYRHPGGDRVTYRTEGFAARKSHPWTCVRGGIVTTLTGATAVEAMRLLNLPDVREWTYVP